MPTKLDQLCINTIRMLSVDGVQKANSGHPGMPMGAAAMAYVLWTRFLRHNPQNPAWADRDRFVLSAGHGSMLLYSLLHLSGYDLSIEALQNFRQWGSKTPGHPEHGLAPGPGITAGGGATPPVSVPRPPTAALPVAASSTSGSASGDSPQYACRRSAAAAASRGHEYDVTSRGMARGGAAPTSAEGPTPAVARPEELRG